jgi:uncharacterized protein (TIGR03000 family)
MRRFVIALVIVVALHGAAVAQTSAAPATAVADGMWRHAAALSGAARVRSNQPARPPVALAAGLQAVAAPATKVKSHFRITVPQDDTELRCDDQDTKTSGSLREMDTPLLDAGRAYEYKFTAIWRPNNYTVITRNKVVRFKAGEEVRVDLTEDDPNDRATIRFVPTPDKVVNQMIELAALQPGDVVFEPGCGDARITIAAVKAGAARGVGIDIDPDRVAESKANVKAAGLDGKIEIRLADALDIKDLSDANVVFLYMGDDFDRLIRPILWKQLKVGARVVSHRFTMGDWQPDRTVSVDMYEDGSEYLVHVWTVTQEVKNRAASN